MCGIWKRLLLALAWIHFLIHRRRVSAALALPSDEGSKDAFHRFGVLKPAVWCGLKSWVALQFARRYQTPFGPYLHAHYTPQQWRVTGFIWSWRSFETGCHSGSRWFACTSQLLAINSNSKDHEGVLAPAFTCAPIEGHYLWFHHPCRLSFTSSTFCHSSHSSPFSPHCPSTKGSS